MAKPSAPCSPKESPDTDHRERPSFSSRPPESKRHFERNIRCHQSGIIEGDTGGPG